jgi:hypothetical protein
MATKEERIKEAKKSKYRKMGFGKMIDSGEIDFGDKHPILKKKAEKRKKYEHPMKEERWMSTQIERLKKSGLKDSEIGDSRKTERPKKVYANAYKKKNKN